MNVFTLPVKIAGVGTVTPPAAQHDEPPAASDSPPSDEPDKE